jgi:hypothetical protein
MRRLEIIHLRWFGGPLDTLSRQIRESLRAAEDSSEVITIYRRHGLETDIAIHIHHSELNNGEGSSTLGLRLASALRALGLVEHTTWEELA